MNAVPYSPVVSATMAAFNDAHDDKYTTTGHFHRSHNGYFVDDSGEPVLAKDLPMLLLEAANLIKDHGDDPVVMADVYCFLDNARYLMPRIECWCVVKHYASPNWKPAVWIGCMTEEQANEMAPVIESRYARHGVVVDRFKVERSKAQITSMIRPELKAAQYLREL